MWFEAGGGLSRGRDGIDAWYAKVKRVVAARAKCEVDAMGFHHIFQAFCAQHSSSNAAALTQQEFIAALRELGGVTSEELPTDKLKRIFKAVCTVRPLMPPPRPRSSAESE